MSKAGDKRKRSLDEVTHEARSSFQIGPANKTARACQRCRRRHIKCLGKNDSGSCDGCRAAGCPCVNRTRVVFKFSRFVNGQSQAEEEDASVDDSTALSPTHLVTSPASNASLRINDICPEDRSQGSTTIALRRELSDSFSPDTTSRSSQVPPPVASPDSAIAVHGFGNSLDSVHLTTSHSPVRDCSPSQKLQRPAPGRFESSTNVAQPIVSPTRLTASPESDRLYAGAPGLRRSQEIPPEPSTGLLSDAREAALLKYFSTNLALWFDYVDPRRFFGTYVVRLAIHDQSLLYALLAVSAKHQSRAIGYDDGTADDYQRRCLSILIPAVNEPHIHLGDTLLAAALILRLFQEMTEPTEEHIETSHNLSVRILLKLKEGGLAEPAFGDAVMRVALRQEIAISNLTQEPSEPNARSCNIDTSFEPADDAMWTFRIMAYTAEISNFVYNSENAENRSPAAWARHWAYVQDWQRLKPDSLNPVYSQTRPGELFPEVWCISDLQIAAYQYYLLCFLLLTASDPRIPAIGLHRVRALKQRESNLRRAVREICGAALTNREWFPAKLMAGLAIALCGDQFHDPEEQRQLLDILVDAEAHVGWRCLKVADMLRQHWHLS